MLNNYFITNKYLKYVIGTLLLLIALLSGFLYYNNHYTIKNMRGKHIFAETLNKIDSLDAIKIISPLSGEIYLHRVNGEWRFKQANDYFVDPEMITDFYNMVKKSLVIRMQSSNKDALRNFQLLNTNEAADGNGLGTLVETYDADGELMDSLIIGKRTGTEDQAYARLNNTNYALTISSLGKFDGYAESWVPYPLLQINIDFVEALGISGQSLGRDQIDNLLQHSSLIRDFFSVLDYIEYQGITLRSDLQQAYPDAQPQRIEVGMLGGMVYLFDIYYVEDSYWMTITLASTKIAHKSIIPFVQQNQRYFADWVFHLDYKQGQTLYRTRLSADMLNK